MEKTKWDLNSIQFPRLLAVLRAVGLTAQQYADLCESMELESSDIDELLERAEEEWEVLKDAHAEDFYAHLFALAKQLGALSLAINVDTRCDAILTFHDGSIRNYAYRDGKWVSAFEMKFEMKR